MVDGIHLGEQGNLLYAALVSRQLVYRPELKAAMDTVHTYEVGRDVQWKDGRLALEFEGNRIDAIAGPGEAGSSSGTAVLIDQAEALGVPRVLCFHTRLWPGHEGPLRAARENAVGRGLDAA